MAFAPSQHHPLVAVSLSALYLITLLPGADGLRDHYLFMRAVAWLYYAWPAMLTFLWPRLQGSLIAGQIILQLSQPPLASKFESARVRPCHPIVVVEFWISNHPEFCQEARRHHG